MTRPFFLYSFLVMIDTVTPLHDVYQTAREMRRLTVNYWADLGPWLDEPFLNFFNYVCALPYLPDPPNVETVSRPAYTLIEGYRPRDCDDKAVLLACWCKGHAVPVRFVAISTLQNGEPCHVFINAAGVDCDATYPEYHGILGKYPYYPQITNRVNLTNYF